MSICITTLLWAIAAVETGHDDSAIGSHGERSQYQISEAVWWQHQDVLAFDQCKGADAEAVARAHVAWLMQRWLRESVCGDRVLLVASAWNQGVAGHLRNGPNGYARRVAAVYAARVNTEMSRSGVDESP
jgi:hypothetical protein